MLAQIVGDERTCEVVLEGSALVPAFSLSETVLDFGSVPCGQSRVREREKEREREREIERE